VALCCAFAFDDRAATDEPRRPRKVTLRSAQHAAPRATAPEVVRALVENHARFLAFLQRRVGSREDAEDILQSAFVRGLERGAALRDEESATAWFYRLLRNALVDHYRRRAAEKRALSKMPPAPETTDEELLEVVCGCVSDLARTLKPEYASALERVEVQGASLRAFADEQGITPNNAAVRLHRARLALRRQVAKSCGTCATHGCLDCTCGGPAGCTPPVS
jgi:RNA polymerase sigma-70 factor (ECF subfamily)